MKWPDDYINKVICGDCLEIMKGIPDGVVDLVLTDPPYGVDGGSGTVGKLRSHKHNYDRSLDTIDYVIISCVSAFKMALDKSPRAILTPGPLAMNYYPQPDSFGVIYQPATCGLQKWGRADAQPIFYYGKDQMSGIKIQSCSYVNTQKPSCPSHPCSKPLNLWRWLLSRGSKEGDIVLDPFLGSGTTAVACKQLGRKYIGIEISPEYCKIAEDRLRQEVLAL